MQNESKGMALGFLGVIAFGLTLPATRFVVPYLDPLFVGLGRAVVAATVAAFWLVAVRRPLPNRAQLRQLLTVAAGIVLGFPLLSAWAMQTVPASHGGVVLGILPLATALAGVLTAGERPSPGFWLSSLAGTAVVVCYSVWTGAGSLQVGDAALLGAVVSAAIAYAVGGRLAREMGGDQVICWALVLSMPAIAGPAWIVAPESFEPIPSNIWAAFLYLALVSQLLGFFLWNAGLAMGGIARVSQTQLAQPFVTIAASAILLGETLEPMTVLCALAVIGLVAVGRGMPIRRVEQCRGADQTYCRCSEE